jgi:hypothetical protein
MVRHVVEISAAELCLPDLRPMVWQDYPIFCAMSMTRKVKYKQE